MGHQIKHYEIQKLLGRGGMAEVYLARDSRDGSMCAVKVLSKNIASDVKYVKRFLHETRTYTLLDHPNIVKLYDGGEHNGLFFMAMEYVDGKSLDDLLKQYAPLPVPIAAYILDQVLAGLQHAHDRNVVHRDIKPANILITSKGEIKLSDFGIAKVTEFTQLTATGQIIGTPSFMSPEQIRGGDIDPRSDLFSLGVMSYILMTGINPFEADNIPNTVMKILQQEPTPIYEIIPTIPVDLEHLLDQLLAKELT